MSFADAGSRLSDQNNLRETELGFPDRSVRELGRDQDLDITNCSPEVVKVKKEEEEDCCKTPTRLDQILPAIPQTCPPAPRKPKGVPSRSLKVRNCYKSRRMIILNVSREFDCMFHSTSLCNKIKKARHI
ncbi:unnamed protein product [Brassica oleracea]|uniref:Uncharacterized protein n=1 Tax=Brassica oleracea var. oleracea TaxID=109376 RepID=A0A0D3BU08_BRAOL|nr:PREDICTED: cyclin-dependent protein kinase inhibitor SMR1 [Brassica oleracea var. oleracea]